MKGNQEDMVNRKRGRDDMSVGRGSDLDRLWNTLAMGFIAI